MLNINTDAIHSTASNIASLNSRLEETLLSCQQTVQSLSGSWMGAAADATIAAFDSFAAKYFSQYKEMLDQYVKFLNNAAGEGYDQTEQQVTSKASQI